MPTSGITYAPELEWVFAAHWDNMTLEQFTQMDGAYQSHIVAAYRTEHRIESVLAEDSRIRMERERVGQQAQQMAEGRSIS